MSLSLNLSLVVQSAEGKPLWQEQAAVGRWRVNWQPDLRQIRLLFAGFESGSRDCPRAEAFLATGTKLRFGGGRLRVGPVAAWGFD